MPVGTFAPQKEEVAGDYWLLKSFMIYLYGMCEADDVYSVHWQNEKGYRIFRKTNYTT